MKTKMTRSLAGILFVLGMLSIYSAIILAEEYNFAGTWRGTYSAAGAGAPPTAGAPPAGRGGPGGAAATGPQKVTLRVKVNKTKATGNFTVGSAATDDIREGKIEGNKLTFKTGNAPAQIYDNDAVMIGEELTVTRTPSGGRGGRPQVMTLKRDK
jgi:hypothetical protein